MAVVTSMTSYRLSSMFDGTELHFGISVPPELMRAAVLDTDFAPMVSYRDDNQGEQHH
jgi:hypothetical protein